MIETITRLGGPSAFLAVPVVVLASITGALFFRGAGERFGTLNDLFSAIALLLLVAPVSAVYGALARAAGGEPDGWLLPLTILTVAGLLIGAIGQLLLIARVIDLSTSFVTGGLGILPTVVWIAALVWLSFGRDLVPAAIGWLGLALLVSASLVAMSSALKLRRATWALASVLVAALLGWLIAVGMALAGPGVWLV